MFGKFERRHDPCRSADRRSTKTFRVRTYLVQEQKRLHDSMCPDGGATKLYTTINVRENPSRSVFSVIRFQVPRKVCAKTKSMEIYRTYNTLSKCDNMFLKMRRAGAEFMLSLIAAPILSYKAGKRLSHRYST